VLRVLRVFRVLRVLRGMEKAALETCWECDEEEIREDSLLESVVSVVWVQSLAMASVVCAYAVGTAILQ
tara:strand:+ start:3520 stop:3726 length:207 start_codon:yes stop_codon:yes gene_type:complete